MKAADSITAGNAETRSRLFAVGRAVTKLGAACLVQLGIDLLRGFKRLLHAASSPCMRMQSEGPKRAKTYTLSYTNVLLHKKALYVSMAYKETRQTQNLLPARACWFESDRGHQSILAKRHQGPRVVAADLRVELFDAIAEIHGDEVPCRRRRRIGI
jgi:hypothetical protein